MNKSTQGAAILLIFAVAECAAQDSVNTHMNSLQVSLRYGHYPKGADRTYTEFKYRRKIGRADVFAKDYLYVLGNIKLIMFGKTSWGKMERVAFTKEISEKAPVPEG